MKEFIRKWFEGLPKIERDEYLIIYQNKVYTPRHVLEEVEKDSALGKDLQRVIEQKKFTSALDKYQLAIIRLKRFLEGAPEFKMAVGPRVYTARELLEEIQKGSKLGRGLIEAEIRKIEILI